MKILHYCNHFSPLSQTFIYDVIVQLEVAGVTNAVVTNLVVHSSERPFNNVIKLPSFRQNFFKRGVLKVGDCLGLYKYNRYEESLKFKNKNFKNIIHKERPQIIHAHFGPAGFEVLPVAKQLNIPLFVSFHGFDAFRLPNDPAWMSRLKEVFDGASVITVVSALMKAHLIDLGCPEDKLQIIHVGKKLEDYPFNNEVPATIKNFLSIGRLTEKKGHDDVIRAFQKVISKFPDLSLKIIGEGPLERELKDLIILHGLEGNIELLGAISHNLTKEYLARADAFILCSKTAIDGDREGIPTVLMEAQALGIPCISTLHSGIPEVFPIHNHWMLAEERNNISIANKIEELLSKSNDSLKVAIKNGREKIENEFNLETEMYKLKDLYISKKEVK